MISPDLSCQTIGRLTVAHRLPNSAQGHSMWRCHCSCGAVVDARGASLKKGHTTSCGCAQRDAAHLQGKANATHGHNRRGRASPTYNSWLAMLARCENPGHEHYSNYGGRGVSVCQRWHSFEVFLHDMGERPADRTLDRKDSNGHYEPTNCRWATRSEQNRNRRNRRAA